MKLLSALYFLATVFAVAHAQEEAETAPEPEDESDLFILFPICFSSSNFVEVLDKGTISIEELQIGDRVKTSKDGHFSRVYSFAHHDKVAQAEYLQIHAGEDVIEISDNHMLYVNNKATAAKNVKVGDKLNESQIVSKIDQVHARGLYAPLTDNGKIMVSGMQASNYVSFMSIEASIQAHVYHALLSPLRLACKVGLCEDETYTAGVSNKLYDLIELSYVVGSMSECMQWMVVLTGAPLLAAGWLLDVVTVHLTALVLLAVVAWMGLRRRSTKVKSL